MTRDEMARIALRYETRVADAMLRALGVEARAHVVKARQVQGRTQAHGAEARREAVSYFFTMYLTSATMPHSTRTVTSSTGIAMKADTPKNVMATSFR